MNIISQKAIKTYTTEGAPVDLVLHFDLRLGRKLVVEGLVDKHGALLDSLVADGPFARVWIYDEYTKTIVWRNIK